MRKALLDGADVNTGDGNNTPIWLAYKRGNLEAVRFRISVPGIDLAPLWNEKLLKGVRLGDLDLMREALQNGADVNTRSNCIYNDTPFTLGCKHGRIDAVRFLLNYPGVDVNAVDEEQHSAFNHACYWREDLELARFLVTLPTFDPFVQNSYGDSCFHNAVMWGEIPLVQDLIARFPDCDVELRSSRGRTALLCACYYGDLDMVKYLLEEHNSDVHAVDAEGYSCLHLLVMGNAPSARFLTISSQLHTKTMWQNARATEPSTQFWKMRNTDIWRKKRRSEETKKNQCSNSNQLFRFVCQLGS